MLKKFILQRTFKVLKKKISTTKTFFKSETVQQNTLTLYSKLIHVFLLTGPPTPDQSCVTTMRPPPSCATTVPVWSRLDSPVMMLPVLSFPLLLADPVTRWARTFHIYDNCVNIKKIAILFTILTNNLNKFYHPYIM